MRHFRLSLSFGLGCSVITFLLLTPAHAGEFTLRDGSVIEGVFESELLALEAKVSRPQERYFYLLSSESIASISAADTSSGEVSRAWFVIRSDSTTIQEATFRSDRASDPAVASAFVDHLRLSFGKPMTRGPFMIRFHEGGEEFGAMVNKYHGTLEETANWAFHGNVIAVKKPDGTLTEVKAKDLVAFDQQK